MNELPKQLELEDLDKIEVFSNGRVGARLGLMFTLYIADAQQKRTILKIGECVKMYQELAGDHLKWFLPINGGVYTRTSSAPPVDVIGFVEREYHEGDSFEVAFTGNGHYLEANPYNVKVVVPEAGGVKAISFISGTFPFALLERQEPGCFAKMIHDWCELTSPLHGYAGLGVIQSCDYNQNRRTRPLAYPLARRFPGLDVENAITLARFLTDGIKGVNWLTIVGDTFLERLGGRARLESQLGENFALRDYPGGAVIRAGKTPQLGDVNRSLIPTHYKKLGGLLAPIRADYPYRYLESATARDPNDDLEASQQWFARFD